MSATEVTVTQEPLFERGQTVKCTVNPPGHPALLVGKEYLVTRCNPFFPEQKSAWPNMVELQGDNGTKIRCPAAWFELVETTKKEQKQ